MWGGGGGGSPGLNFLFFFFLLFILLGHNWWSWSEFFVGGGIGHGRKPCLGLRPNIRLQHRESHAFGEPKDDTVSSSIPPSVPQLVEPVRGWCSLTASWDQWERWLERTRSWGLLVLLPNQMSTLYVSTGEPFSAPRGVWVWAWVMTY